MNRRPLRLTDIRKKLYTSAGNALRQAVNKGAFHKITVGFTEDIPAHWQSTVNAFKEAGDKALAEGRKSFETEGKTFLTSTYTKLTEGEASYDRIYQTYTKLLGTQLDYELGHIGTSILAIRIASYLKDARDPTIKTQLSRLLAVVTEIDNMVEPSDMTERKWADILDSISSQNFTVDYKMIVGDTTDLRLTMAWESKDFNQKKGRLSRAVSNLVDQVLSRAEIDIAKELYENIDITEIINSPTFNDAYEKRIVSILDPKKPTKAYTSKGSLKGKLDLGLKKINSKKIKATKLPVPQKKEVREIDYFSLINIINDKLPEVVMYNMRPPALQNRTGGFAESAEVVDVIKTPKGFPSFGYTYDKTPYQVFEMGVGRAPWATPQRDPRAIIEKSIRQIATGFMGGRFFLRRI